VSTETTVGLEAVLRTRLLEFVPLDGSGSVADELGATDGGSGAAGKLFWNRAPDNIDGRAAGSTDPTAWGVLRLKNRRSGGDHGERDLMELEVMLYGRPTGQRALLEGIADRMDQAMLRYSDRSSGLVGTFPGRTRNTLPPFKEPAASDVVQVMLEYTLVVWPAYLIQYHDSVEE
jgi:hypothetical protein